MVNPDAGSGGGGVLQYMTQYAVDTSGNELLNNKYYELWQVEEFTNKVGIFVFGGFEEGGFEESPQDRWSTGRDEKGKMRAIWDGKEGIATFTGEANYINPVSSKEIVAEMNDMVQPAGPLASRRGDKGPPNFPNSKKSNTVNRKITVNWCWIKGATKEQRMTKINEISPGSYNLDRTPR